MRKWLWIICALIIGGCMVKNNSDNRINNNLQRKPVALPIGELEIYGPAPELTNDIWINSNEPLRLGDLRGKVVLLEMWTFG